MNILKILILLNVFQGLIYAQETRPDEKKYSEAEIESLFSERYQKKIDERISSLKPPHIHDLARQLIKKEDELLEKEKRIKEKEEQLALFENDLLKKISSFEEDQKKILGCVNQLKEGEKKRFLHMSEIIKKMRPKSAALIIGQQEREIAVQLLAMLPADKASKIFNILSDTDKVKSAELQKSYLLMAK